MSEKWFQILNTCSKGKQSYIRGSRILIGCIQAILEISSPYKHIPKFKNGSSEGGLIKSNDYNCNSLRSFIPGGTLYHLALYTRWH